MPAYTVHEPPLKADETSVPPERFVFVRDRFAFWAFVLPPLWFAMKRLWLVLVLYLVAAAAIGVVLHLIGVSPGARLLCFLLFDLLIGLEAASLQRWTLTRRKWKQSGVVIADTLEEAERRFFAAWVARREAADTEPAEAGQTQQAFMSPVINPLRTTSQHPLGLFLEPGGGR